MGARMRIAVSATAPDLDGEVDPRFGRCQCLLVVNSESMDFETIENPAMSAAGGAGIQAAQAVVNAGAEALLTGDCGPNAYRVLSEAGISVFTGVSGKVRDAIDAFGRGEYCAAASASAGPNAGTR
jgi:predicted Fe-Mo cluster-binding NifX family protein